MQTRNLRRGKLGEDLAASYLAKHGYRILSRNFHTRYGEIDLIAMKGRSLIFVEVKTRGNDNFGAPIDSVTRSKLAKLRLASEYYLMQHPKFLGPVQIDVVAITLGPTGKLDSLEHLQSVNA